MNSPENGARVPVDHIVVGRVVTMNAKREIFSRGAVAIAAGDIVAVGERDTLMQRYQAGSILGSDSSIVLPGLIDAHTHCTACFARGLTTGELPMIPRLYNPGQRCHTPEEAKTAIRLVAAQLLRSGTTTVCEGSLIPEQEEAMLEALEEVGIRCCFARGYVDQEFSHAALYAQVRERSSLRVVEGAAEKDLRVTEALLKRYPPRGRQKIRAAVSPSSLTGFSEGYFRGAAALARQFDTTVQVHANRDREEVEFCLSMWGRRPIERLFDLGIVDKNLVVIHGVMTTRPEIDLLGEASARLVHSPIEAVCNINAMPDIQSFRHCGVTVCLGCDNQANDMLETMRATWLIHGTAWGIPRYDPEYLTPETIIAMATIDAAKALQMDDRVGSLETGKAADLMILDGRRPHLFPVQDLLTEVIRFATRAEVQHVMVDGKLLIEDGRHTSIDIDALFQDAMPAAARERETINRRRYKPLPPA